MSRKLLCSLIVLIPSLAFAEQYKFSSFSNRKQSVPLRKIVDLPNEYYVSVSGSLLPDRLLSFYAAKNRHNTFLYQSIRNQTNLISLNGGYSIDKQNGLEINIASSRYPANITSSLTYKYQHALRTSKLVASTKVGIMIPIAWEEEYDNISRKVLRPDDSASMIRPSRSKVRGRSRARAQSRAPSQSRRSKSRVRARSSHAGERKHRTTQTLLGWMAGKASPQSSTFSTQGRSTRKLATKRSASHHASRAKSVHSFNNDKYDTYRTQEPFQYTTQKVYQYQRYGGCGLTASFSIAYPLHPDICLETSVNAILPLTDTLQGRSGLPLGMIKSIQMGLHFKLA